ncbi:MAG: tRNA uridine(34) 5-carboxymethylaminomethyl modification radical SAM/GNAT enzyme Elp3 [Candidatus Pacebacteria bacterium]|nr:tRNA uridine(34) 5-carboxymethylaminomethyl modification radical SAM/GNAT enzyme Elp3 [Candidatus Paceibacterota bacterium]
MKLKGFNLAKHQDQMIKLIKLMLSQKDWDKKSYSKVIKKFTKEDGRLYSKDELIFSYKQLVGTNDIPEYDEKFLNKIKMKPVRTGSGVTPVTVLTKPFPCPGKCIFCPSDIRMPKSYLSDEPGAQRAERNWFDPYLQVYNRLQALKNIGHKVEKVELIILGGTWSYYPENYQIWFIKECFRALNEFGNKDGRGQILSTYNSLSDRLTLSSDPIANQKKLESRQIKGEDDQNYNQVIDDNYLEPEKELGLDKVQTATWEELECEQVINETASARSVGLVIETRPDHISEKEVIRVRRLGCTKTQIGVQSLSDDVLKKNKRGHNVAATRRAFKLLRLAGFKIHAHMMANLYGSTPENDIEDFKKLFSDPDFKPDELKLYPCSLIASAELMQYYNKGLWKPYSYDELLDVLSSSIKATPEYCRLTRVIRDIPSTDIVVGNKLTNFRQIAEDKLKKIGEESIDIRAREIRGETFKEEEVELKITDYKTSVSDEKFIQYIVKRHGKEKILAFLRLSLPSEEQFIDELKGSAMIREIHVYGGVVNIGEQSGGKVQHLGLGTKLIEKAKQFSKEAGYKKLNVISAIGTKEYYRKKGFTDGDLYQYLDL